MYSRLNLFILRIKYECRLHHPAFIVLCRLVELFRRAIKINCVSMCVHVSCDVSSLLVDNGCLFSLCNRCWGLVSIRPVSERLMMRARAPKLMQTTGVLWMKFLSKSHYQAPDSGHSHQILILINSGFMSHDLQKRTYKARKFPHLWCFKFCWRI